ncbi:type I-E CRISPR-associated protein Cas6/Cse3/CasE [Microbacterium suaedae]|uniref:type I-E CRISPR-associated protein Cas6/Cse3/CasE n=1 Tax=Microbacterium suaedae TaxID=2067813 RepID=UPI000DA21D48|nr:type I-E CRISPR-associated protein Cas6/Cse3/CasE [Microbacterium suaedae]
MYFTRFAINLARRGSRHLVSSPHRLHAAIMAGFPNAEPTPDGRVLWRLDNTAHGAAILVVSPRQPDFTHLAEQAGWPSLDDAWETRRYVKLLDTLEPGLRYRFRLTANPVRRERRPDGERGKPYGHVTVSQQEKWLLDRADTAGFRVNTSDDDGSDLVVSDRRTLKFHRRETQVTLRVATYEGVLTVTDADALRRALCHGIGRAKGYGCGLLTLAPAR